VNGVNVLEVVVLVAHVTFMVFAVVRRMS